MEVSFDRHGDRFTGAALMGPAEFVFEAALAMGKSACLRRHAPDTKFHSTRI
jgi:hypothetical protein